MTFAAPNGPGASTTARIRILGDPHPVPEPAGRRPLIALTVLVAIAGVGLALGLQALRPSQMAAQQLPASTVAIGVGAPVPQAVEPSRPYLQRVLRKSSHAPVAAAARQAAAVVPQPRSRPAHSWAPTPAQQPVAVPQTQSSTTAQTPTVTREPTVAVPRPVGPEAPPNPVNPNSQMGSP